MRLVRKIQTLKVMGGNPIGKGEMIQRGRGRKKIRRGKDGVRVLSCLMDWIVLVQGNGPSIV
jgi:hypothetical protein